MSLTRLPVERGKCGNSFAFLNRLRLAKGRLRRADGRGNWETLFTRTAKLQREESLPGEALQNLFSLHLEA